MGQNLYLDVFVSKQKFSSFLDFILNENSIGEFSEFLQKLYRIDENNNFKNIYDSNGNNYSTYYKIIMFLLYHEYLNVNFTELEDLLNKDYADLVAYCNQITAGSLMNHNGFLRDKIRNIYSNRVDIISYKDTANIKKVINDIYNNDLTSEEQSLFVKLPDAIKSDNELNFYKYFYRVNNSKAEIENNIAFISLLYNTNILDEFSKYNYIIEKHPIYGNTDSNITINLTNINNIRIFIDEVKESNSDKKRSQIFRDMIDSIFLKIKNGTINYE